MKWSRKIVLAACLVAASSYLALGAENSQKQPRPAKKVFTNEDLDGMRGAEAASEPSEESEVPTAKAADGSKTDSAATRAGDANSIAPKTKEQRIVEIQSIRTKLKNTKLNEVRAIQSLAVYQKRAQEAEDNFHKETAEEQSRDMEVHVTRLGDERKKLETQLEKMNKAARDAGVKEEELLEKETTPEPAAGTTEMPPPSTASKPVDSTPAAADNSTP